MKEKEEWSTTDQRRLKRNTNSIQLEVLDRTKKKKTNGKMSETGINYSLADNMIPMLMFCLSSCILVM